jgi:uncharacterized protein YndB with AHSA1/START domain
MDISFTPDFPVDDASCQQTTGKSFAEWAAVLEEAGLTAKRREAINLIYDQTGRGKDVWWPTTIWVELERQRGVVKKDGRSEGYNICCTKSFKLTPEEVFRAFASTADVDSWVGGWQGEIADGAPFSVAGCGGTVGRIRPGKDLRLSWQSPGFDPSEVEIQLTTAAGKTTVNIFHKRLQTRAEADGLRRAWGAALDRLKAKLAT